MHQIYRGGTGPQGFPGLKGPRGPARFIQDHAGPASGTPWWSWTYWNVLDLDGVTGPAWF